MVARFLLHDPSDMSIRGVSGKSKFCIWGGMLEGYRHCQEAFCLLECLLCQCSPPNVLDPPHSWDQLKSATPVCSWQIKIKHAEETLQLFNILGGGQSSTSVVWAAVGGCPCCRNLVAKNFQRRHCKDTFFKIDAETIGGQNVEKNFQVAEVCLPVRRSYAGVVHVCKHTFQTLWILCGAVHNSLKVCAGLESPNGENK
jgi:hypothetical protein